MAMKTQTHIRKLYSDTAGAASTRSSRSAATRRPVNRAPGWCLLALASSLGFGICRAADPWKGGWTPGDTRVAADVNGDGRADIIAFGDDGVYVSLAKPDGSGFTLPSKWSAAFGTSTDAGGWNSNHIRTVADVDGDGKADIVGFGETATYVALSTGRSFATPVVASSAFCHASGPCGAWTSDDPRVMADVDGDGKADIVGFGETATYVALSTSTPGTATFGPPTSVLSAFCKSSTCGGWSNDFPRLVADVNNDKMADIVGFGAGATYVSLSTSTPGRASFGPPVASLTTYCSSTACGSWTSENPRFLADVNGDGKADIVGFGESVTYVSLSTSTPTAASFATPAPTIASFCRSSACGGWSSNNVRLLADVDGRGEADIIGFGSNATYVSLSTSTPTAASFADPNIWTGSYSTSTTGFLSNWMADLNDDIADFTLKDIAIPGTHDSGTYTLGVGTIARTQALDITGQLSHGARYLDIRPERGDDNGDPNNYYIHHGVVTTSLRLDTVYDQLKAFLDAHPREIVLLDESQSPDNRLDSLEIFFHKVTDPIADRLITEKDILEVFPGYKCSPPSTGYAGCLQLNQIRTLQVIYPKKQILLFMSTYLTGQVSPPLSERVWVTDGGTSGALVTEYSATGLWGPHQDWLDVHSKRRVSSDVPAKPFAATAFPFEIWTMFAQLTPGAFPGFLADLYNGNLADFITSTDTVNGWKYRLLNVVSFDFLEYPDDNIPQRIIANNLLPFRGCLLPWPFTSSREPGGFTMARFMNGTSEEIELQMSGDVNVFYIDPGDTRQLPVQVNVPILGKTLSGRCVGVTVPHFGQSSEEVVVFDHVLRL